MGAWPLLGSRLKFSSFNPDQRLVSGKEMRLPVVENQAKDGNCVERAGDHFRPA